jgi:hypothetical protein
MHFEEGVQTTFGTHKLEFFPKFEELGHNSLEYYAYLSSP